MRIALVILHADPTRGGAERYTVDLAKALSSRGHEVKLLAADFGDVPAEMRVLLPATGITRTGRYKRFLRSLDTHLAQQPYDIVHAMLPVNRCDVYHPHAGMAAEQMQSWQVHFNPRRKLMARTERALLSGSQAPVVIALSDYVKASIRRYFDMPDDRLVRLFNAVDIQHFDPQRDEPWRPRLETQHGWPESPVALMIAQDFDRKGLRAAMTALAQLDDLMLVVVGRDDPTPYRYANEACGKRTLFVGPTGNTWRYYKGADFFVLPTKHDPCSLVVLEALAMGLPVISTRCNGACEIMSDGVHGFVLNDPSDVHALAEAMQKLLDPVTRQRMSQACLALRPQLAYQHHVDQLLRIYSTCRSGG